MHSPSTNVTAPSRPSFHLVCGGIGSGKTTYARHLASEVGGVAFSIDEWMVTLFGADAPQPLDMSWLAPRIARCERQIWATAVQVAATAAPAVLDLGFQLFEHRSKYARLAAEAGFELRLHHLDVASDERWRRIEKRNAARNGTFALEVSRPMFDFMEQRWQAPADIEMAAMNGVLVASS